MKNKQNNWKDIELFRNTQRINPDKLIYFHLKALSPNTWFSVKIGEIEVFYTNSIYYTLKHPSKKVQRCTFNSYE